MLEFGNPASTSQRAGSIAAGESSDFCDATQRGMEFDAEAVYPFASTACGFLPRPGGGQFMVTIGCRSLSERPFTMAETFEGAARLLDMGQNLRFLVFIFARPGQSVCRAGDFERAKRFMKVAIRGLEKSRPATEYQTRTTRKSNERREEAIKSIGIPSRCLQSSPRPWNFLVEVCSESAPSSEWLNF